MQTETLPPNAIKGLWQQSGKSAAQISNEIYARYGVRIHDKAIIRAAHEGTGIGKANWRILADYFGLKPWELYDPTLPEKISQKI